MLPQLPITQPHTHTTMALPPKSKKPGLCKNCRVMRDNPGRFEMPNAVHPVTREPDLFDIHLIGVLLLLLLQLLLSGVSLLAKTWM